MAQEAEASMMEAAGLDRARSPDDSLSVRFLIEPMENPAKSKEAGRPIFDDTEIIEIRAPGDKDIVRHPVTNGDRLRFGRTYEAWKKNQNQDVVTGTPLAAWPMIKRSQAEEAKFFALHTVEQLAEVSDVNLQRLGPGWITLRQNAQDWLKKAKDGAMLGKLRAELEERDRRIDALEEMLKRQAAELHRPVGEPAPVPQNPDLEALKMQVATLLARQAEIISPPKPRDPNRIELPSGVVIGRDPPKKKRGRPSRADIAAREAAKNGQG